MVPSKIGLFANATLCRRGMCMENYSERIRTAKQLAHETKEKNKLAQEKRIKEVTARQEQERMQKLKPYLDDLVKDLEENAKQGIDTVKLHIPNDDIEYAFSNNSGCQVRSYTLTDQLIAEIRKMGLRVEPKHSREQDHDTYDYWLEVTYS